jgi:hypothetical protein
VAADVRRAAGLRSERRGALRELIARRAALGWFLVKAAADVVDG